MFYYRIYGKSVYTDLHFRQLVEIEPISKTEADIIIVAGTVSEEIKSQETVKMYSFGDDHSWLINRTVWFEVCGGREIVYEKRPGGNEEYLKTYLLGFGLSMLHLQRGEMAIHCAAVSKGDKAYLVAGESGSGKSTLTTRFLEEGFSLMADDCAVVAADESGRVKVYPAFPFQKLCRDVVKEKGLDIEQLIYINEEKDKFLVPYEGEFSTEGVPFAGMFCLAVDPKIENCVMQLVEGISKLHFCVGNLFLRRLLRHGMITPKLHFECLKLIGNVPVHFILRPEKGDTLEKIWAYIENCLAE